MSAAINYARFLGNLEFKLADEIAGKIPPCGEKFDRRPAMCRNNDEERGSPKLDTVYIERRTTERRKPTDWVLYTKRKPGSQKLFLFFLLPSHWWKTYDCVSYYLPIVRSWKKISASSCKTQKLSTNLSSGMKSARRREKNDVAKSSTREYCRDVFFSRKKKSDNETRTKWQIRTDFRRLDKFEEFARLQDRPRRDRWKIIYGGRKTPVVSRRESFEQITTVLTSLSSSSKVNSFFFTCFSWLRKLNSAAFFWSFANLFSYFDTFFKVGFMLGNEKAR